GHHENSRKLPDFKAKSRIGVAPGFYTCDESRPIAKGLTSNLEEKLSKTCLEGEGARSPPGTILAAPGSLRPNWAAGPNRHFRGISPEFSLRAHPVYRLLRDVRTEKSEATDVVPREDWRESVCPPGAPVKEDPPPRRSPGTLGLPTAMGSDGRPDVAGDHAL